MGDSIRVLLVEDSPSDAGIVNEYLEADEATTYEVASERRLADGLERIAWQPFDAILLDLGLPDSVGLDTLRAMVHAANGTPIVVLTGRQDSESGLAAIRDGAQDYVLKVAMTPDGLQRALRYAIERRRSRVELESSRALLRTVIDNLPDAIYVKDAEARKVLANRVDVANIGATDETEVLGKTDLELFPADVSSRTDSDDRSVLQTGVSVLEREELLSVPGGTEKWLLTSKIALKNAQGAVTGLVGIGRDITRRRNSERLNLLARQVLECLNRASGDTDPIGEILHLVKATMGVDAVAIRLHQGEDYPYYQTNGFPGHFVQAENYLCARDEAGELVRDAAGNPVLECMCGRILRGRTDPARPFFTAGGSFWSNSTTDFLVTTSEEDRDAHMRNRCNGEGYESLALIPLRIGQEVIGLLQLNDRRRGQFNAETIAFLEGLGASIGIALARRQGDEALRASEAQYRLLAEHMTDTIQLLSLTDLQPIYSSPSMTRARGYSLDELQNMALEEKMTAESARLTRQTFAEEGARLQSDPAYELRRSLEIEFYRADGTTYWSEVTLSLIRDEAGIPMAILSEGRDISERRRANRALHESEARFQQLFDNMPDGVAVYEALHDGEDFVLIDLNRTGQIVSRVSPEDALGQRVTDVFSGVARMGLLDMLRRVWRTGQSEHMPPTLYTDSRLTQWVENFVYRLPSGLVVTIYSDSSAQREAEQARRVSEQRYRNIVLTALDGFWQLDKQGRLLDVNDAYCTMSGYSREELLSMSILDLDATQVRVDEALHAQTLADQGEVRFESQHRRKDGSVLHVDIGLRSDPADSGRVVGFLRDNTARILAEEEHERLEVQLRQSQKMEAVGQLAGGVAHDLNNMLGVINGYAEMTLQDLQRSNPMFQDITEIREAGERSAQLTRQLLAFARRQAIAPVVLDLNVSLEGMLAMLRRLVGENVHLMWKPGTSMWMVNVDPGQIDQILANLVVNARDAIDGVGTVTIETENAELDDAYCHIHLGSRPGQYVAVVVTDDGCGMGPDVLEHIFEPFFTTKPVGQGTGLGLATVYGIVKQNSGYIDVASEPGKGTSFRIYLPRHAAPGELVVVDADMVEAPTGTETVLVVEDEVALLHLCRRVLERLGYSVLSANTPYEGLRLAAAHAGEIDLLLTDVVMPGMSGRKLRDQLTDAYPGLRYLFMSGYAAGPLNQQGVMDSDPWLIQKPFTRTQLARRVRAALDEQKRGRG